jgi:hypothetical protein
VAPLAVARWLVRSTGRTPLAWAAWLFVASLGPLLWWAEPLGILGVLVLVTAFSAAALLPRLLVDAANTPRAALAPLATVAHLSALTLLVARMPTSSGPRAVLLVALVWWIPAALGASGCIAPSLTELLDVPGRLASLHRPVETPLVALADMAPTGAATLAAWLLDPPAPSRR